jgi:PmbA protein
MNSAEDLAKLKNISDYTIEKALKLGAERVFVSCSYGKQSRVSYEKGDFNLAARHEGTGLAITVHADQKSGSASINTHDRQAVDGALKRALTLAKHSVPDEYLAMAPKATYQEIDLPIDPLLADMDLETVISLSKDFVSQLQIPKVSIDTASMEQSYGARHIANSLGMEASDASSSLNWSAMGMAVDGDDVTSFDYDGDFCSSQSDAETKISKTAKSLREKLISQLNAQKVSEGYTGQLLLCPSLVDELLLDPTMFHLLGGNIMDGKSRHANAIGSIIAPKNFTLLDDPHNTTMRGCTTYSGEGVPTKAMTILDNGELKTHFDSIYSAKRRGAKPTGNGAGPHVAVLKAGEHHLNGLRKRNEGPLLAPSRFSGNIDPMTGDFSGVAKGGRWWINGEDQGPVKELMMAGNIFDVLSRPVELSSEVETDGGYYQLPSALIDGVTVSSD